MKLSELDRLVERTQKFDQQMLSKWGFKTERIELFGIDSDELYVVPEGEALAIKRAVNYLRNQTASVVVSGPLGAGKTTFLEMIQQSLNRLPNIRAIRLEGVSSADALIDDLVHANIGEQTVRDFLIDRVGVRVVRSGSVAKRLSRLLLALRTDAEENGTSYVFLIDEFRQLERQRPDNRVRIVDTLLRMVNDKTRDGRRYVVLALAVITRVGESAIKTLEILSSVGETLGHGTKSAIRRRFVEIYDMRRMNKSSAMKVMLWRIAYLKGAMDKLQSNSEDSVDYESDTVKELLYPYTVEALEGIFSYSGGNPGIMLELLLRCLQDAVRGAEVLVNDGYTLDHILSAYQIDFNYVQRFVQKEVKRARAEFSSFQTELLSFLSVARSLDEIEDWLQIHDSSWENVLEDFDLFEKQGLIYSPEAGRIQATELWTKGSTFV
ncbi:MAG: AAA family ATPase [Candidatus Hermodarchaeota archaeon]|jgi:type II secretory pathway predicted ATPase ExeA|nr:AAA family ATPase [Candidatus Hermodarchaeota archaeon]